MKPKQPIPLAAYEPDRGIASGAGQIAKGVLSRSGRYIPLPGLTAYRAGSALVDNCLGGAGFYDSVGAPVTFLGDRSRLYRVLNRAPVDVSKSGGYSGDADWQWSFAQFGDNIMAALRGDTLQRFVLGSSTAFADVSGAPVAEIVFRVRQHLFACSGRTVNWSAFNDVTDWAPSSETQAGNTTIGQDAGIIVAGIGGEQGALFQERGIIRIGYQGGDIPWIFDEVEGGLGACSPSSVRPWGKGAFVVSEGGFYFWDGLTVQPLGKDKVDATFLSDLNYPARGRITSAIDAANSSWMVAYPSGSSATCDKVLIFNWKDGRWTHDDIDVQALIEMPREGVTADDQAGLTALLGTAVADSMNVSVDSPLFRESRRSWACVDATRTLKTFTGPNREAVVETGTFEPHPGAQTYLTEVAPVTDGEPGDVSAEVYVRPYRLGETPVLADSGDMDDMGLVDVRAEGRFMQGRVTIHAGAKWSEVIGLHWDGRPSGGR